MTRRRALATLALACGLAALPRGAARADVAVPVRLQAQLIAKIAVFDRNFAARAGDSARILVVTKATDDESAEVGAHVAAALGDVHKIGAASTQADVAAYAGAAALAERCRSQRVAVVYLSTGLEAEAGAIAGALTGVDVLTIGATAAFPSRGTVVGFDLEEGKPRIVVNLARAKAQNVDFRAELLKLARLVTST